MKRDQELLHKLLLVAERSEPQPDMSGYTEEQQAYHAAILIDSGLVDGKIIRDGSGNVATTVMIDLTPKGHDYLENLRKAKPSDPAKPSPAQSVAELPMPVGIEIFISHSKRDEELVAQII